MGLEQSDVQRLRTIHWWYALFFISGFPALLYQIVWQRSLFAIYGVNIESVTIVVTAFMLGLGLGSFRRNRAGRSVDGVRRCGGDVVLVCHRAGGQPMLECRARGRHRLAESVTR